jgi:hypothetical protein
MTAMTELLQKYKHVCSAYHQLSDRLCRRPASAIGNPYWDVTDMPELKESFARIHEGAVIIARIAVEDVDKLKAILEADLYPDSNWILAEIIAAGNYNKYQELMKVIDNERRFLQEV